MRKRFFAGVITIFLAAASVAAADPVNDALRQAFGATLGPLGGAIDAVFAAASAPSRGARRTVPLIDAETGSAGGAAQVSGADRDVARVRAVMLVTTDYAAGNGVQLRAFIPVDRIEAGPHFHRVYGVAVNAIANF